MEQGENYTTKKRSGLERKGEHSDGCLGQRCRQWRIGAREGRFCRRRDRFVAMLSSPGILPPSPFSFPPHLVLSLCRNPAPIPPSLCPSLSSLCVSPQLLFVSLSLSLSRICSAFFDRGNSLLCLARLAMSERVVSGDQKEASGGMDFFSSSSRAGRVLLFLAPQ